MFGLCFPGNKSTHYPPAKPGPLAMPPSPDTPLSGKPPIQAATGALANDSGMRSTTDSAIVYVQLINESNNQAKAQVSVHRGQPGQIGNCFGAMNLDPYSEKQLYTANKTNPGELIAVVVRGAQNNSNFKMPNIGDAPNTVNSEGIQCNNREVAFCIKPEQDLNLEVSVGNAYHTPDSQIRYGMPGLKVSTTAHQLLVPSHFKEERLGDIVTMAETEVVQGLLSRHASFTN